MTPKKLKVERRLHRVETYLATIGLDERRQKAGWATAHQQVCRAAQDGVIRPDTTEGRPSVAAAAPCKSIVFDC
jgi:hypothetical protein